VCVCVNEYSRSRHIMLVLGVCVCEGGRDGEREGEKIFSLFEMVCLCV
jgi:hypothetical protein